MKSFCNLCGAVVDVPRGKVGGAVACPECGHAFTVPAAFEFSEDEVLDVVADWSGSGDAADGGGAMDPTVAPGEFAEADLVWEAAKCTVPADGDGRRRLMASFRFASLVRAKAFIKGLPFVRIVDDVTGQIAFPSRVTLDLKGFKGGEARVALRGQFDEDEIDAMRNDAPRHGARLEGVGW